MVKEQLRTSKSFGEILDLTFRLCKTRFRELFMILLVLLGPVYVLQALIQLIDGVQLFINTGSGESGPWYETFVSRFETESASVGATLLQGVLGLAGFVLIIIAQTAVFYRIYLISKGQEASLGSVVRYGLSRFWPVLGSTLLFCLLLFAAIFVMVLVFMLAGLLGVAGEGWLSAVFGIIFGLAGFIAVFYILSRLSLFFGAVVLKEDAPGLSRSWHLTKGRIFQLMAMYVVLVLIISVISAVLQLTLTMLLGASVLLGLIVNLVALFTTMIFITGYSVIYLDCKTRYDADDLKEMLFDQESDDGGHHAPIG